MNKNNLLNKIDETIIQCNNQELLPILATLVALKSAIILGKEKVLANYVNQFSTRELENIKNKENYYHVRFSLN